MIGRATEDLEPGITVREERFRVLCNRRILHATIRGLAGVGMTYSARQAEFRSSRGLDASRSFGGPGLGVVLSAVAF